MKNKKILFIGGSSYSGSTMLDMMLSNSDSGFSVGEVHALFRPFRPHHFNPRCGCGDPNCSLWVHVRQQGEDRLYQTIFDRFEQLDYIVDSSKDPFWINKQSQRLRNQGIEVHHLLIWKTPVDFCASMLKRNRTGCIKAWVNYHTLYLSLITDFMPVSYVDLVTYPSATLSSINHCIGVNHSPDMENYWTKTHHTLFGNDSAKVHLHKDSSDLTIEDNQHSSVIDGQGKQTADNAHRSIYYKQEQNLVDSQTVNEIQGNPDIQAILAAVSGHNLEITQPDFHAPYPRHTLMILALISRIKFLAGKIFGRYVRLF